jgi:hypothetical protein|tara:strand:- start:107 stop:490 length:384 start_codon:yes stop_codon:yes gene_type:complete
MNKKEFLKKAMGAQYSEREDMEMGLLKRLAKQNLGAQYTENELNRNMGVMDTANQQDAYGNPQADIDYEKLRQDFSNVLGGITPQEQEQVINHWQKADDEGKTKFMQYVVANPPRATGYGIQNEVGY